MYIKKEQEDYERLAGKSLESFLHDGSQAGKRNDLNKLENYATES